MSGDEQLIEDVSESVLKSTNAKRQPSKIVPLSKGDRVRVIDEKYLASKLRSNDQKMQPRGGQSRMIYTIRTVKSANTDTGFMPQYVLTKIQGQVETARATSERTVDTDAQPFDSYNALPDLKRSTRVTDAQKQTDALKQYEGRRLW